MPTPTLRQILAAMEDRLERIPGLSVTDFVPGHVNVPAAVIGVPPIDRYLTSLGGRRPELAPTITALTSTAIDRIGQLALADFADTEGERSIPAVFAADPTLGGLVGSCHVVSFRPLGLEEVGIIGYFGGVLTTRILF